MCSSECIFSFGREKLPRLPDMEASAGLLVLLYRPRRQGGSSAMVKQMIMGQVVPRRKRRGVEKWVPFAWSRLVTKTSTMQNAMPCTALDLKRRSSTCY